MRFAARLQVVGVGRREFIVFGQSAQQRCRSTIPTADAPAHRQRRRSSFGINLDIDRFQHDRTQPRPRRRSALSLALSCLSAASWCRRYSTSAATACLKPSPGCPGRVANRLASRPDKYPSVLSCRNNGDSCTSQRRDRAPQPQTASPATTVPRQPSRRLAATSPPTTINAAATLCPVHPRRIGLRRCDSCQMPYASASARDTKWMPLGPRSNGLRPNRPRRRRSCGAIHAMGVLRQFPNLRTVDGGNVYKLRGISLPADETAASAGIVI